MLTRLRKSIARIFTGKPEAKTFGRSSERRWDATETNRLNRAHWAGANQNHINTELPGKLETLVQRCIYEASNNPHVEGVINTHANDIVGENGPTLQIQSENEQYDRALESYWRWWAAHCDYNGQFTLQDLLRSDVNKLWKMGAFVHQAVNDLKSPNKIQFRLIDIDPRRLRTPWGAGFNANIVMGVERTETGKPIAYHFDGPIDNGINLSLLQSTRIDAQFIFHGFDLEEPGQAGGVPWLASALPTIADMRELDAQTIDAVRAAADHPIVIETPDPDGTAPMPEAGTTAEYERRQMTVLPAGSKAVIPQPAHPVANFLDFRAALMAGLGRKVGMPLMMIMLDSAGHNYSSARFDGQIYQRANRTRQAWFERVLLNKCLERLAREAELLGLLPKRPAEVRVVWTWPVPPHVDPSKEAAAEGLRLANGTQTLAGACAAHGLDWEEVVQQRAREIKKLQELGIPLGALGGIPSEVAQQVAADNKAEAESDTQANSATDSRNRMRGLLAPHHVLNGVS